MSTGVDGFDRLERQLQEAQDALRALDDRIIELHFDPADAASVQHAISEMERMIDERAAPYQGNPVVEQLADELKQQLKADILERAGKARHSDPAGE